MVFDSPRGAQASGSPTERDDAAARPGPVGACSGRRLMVVFNPTAGGNRRRRLMKTLRHLDAHGCAVALRETAKPGDAEVFAMEASAKDCDVVVIAGGDGTINEAINGISRGTGEVALGIIPLGTANVLAHEIGLSIRPAKVAAALAQGPIRRIHLGEADGRKFMLMAGAGFDAEVVEHVNLKLKRVIGKGAYILEMLRQARAYGFPTLHVTAEDTGETRQAATAVALNGRHYGGPYKVVGDGGLSAASLDMVLLKRKGMFNVIRYATGLATGRLARFSDVEVLRGSSFSIDGGNDEPVQGDGDIIARLPTRMRVAEETIEVVFPQA
ncbi:diacylglycerol/lipid kinase family protein [Caenispirillum salinarum]|nr:diacylglycerol kinase family protein [Caenispirillum salinarum]